MAQQGRLTTTEVARVFDEGRALNHRWFTLRILSAPGSGEATRWGIAVGKRMAGNSVERNRLRRRVAAATGFVDAPSGLLIVVQLRRVGSGIAPVPLGAAISDRLKRELARPCTGG
jgi:RNase P protein component